MSTGADSAAGVAGRASEDERGPAALRGASKDNRAQSIDIRPLGTLLDRIEAKYHPEQVWLFGSRARGDARPTSDWDLVVVVPDDTEDRELDPLVAWRLQRGSGVYADVIPCRASEFLGDRETVNTLAYIVASEGVLIYER
jgi:predicted nucleotidyltransferase